jgi:alanine-synthesizing transaminase
MFSARVPSLRANRVSRMLAAVRAAGRPIDDLTESNPTRVGLHYPERLLEPLSASAGREYHPAAFGLQTAREAVAAHLTARGVAVAAERVVLTASSSESYSFLFKLLCDPADLVLTPQPSYPLFEHLTRLDGVVASPYLLEYYGDWRLDLESLRSRVEPKVRAVLLVNPNNPTGSWVDADELAAVRDLAARHELAIVSDEVFDRYPLDDTHPGRPGALVADSEVLTFTLGGLSKSAGLPQLKLGWIVVGGPERLVRPALTRLELICDSYLSVTTPVQLAVGQLLDETRPLVRQLRDRVRHNYGVLGRLAHRYPAVQVLRSDGGWYAVLQVPSIGSEEALVLSLLEKDGVLVHPGYFFDFPRESFLVLSLLPEPGRFATAVERLLARVSG